MVKICSLAKTSPIDVFLLTNEPLLSLMVVRLAIPRDASSIKHLKDEWMTEAGQGKQKLKTIKNMTYSERFIVAAENDKIIGYSLFYIKKAKRNEFLALRKNQRYVYVDELFVTKRYRSKKLGNKLLSAVERYAKKKGISSVHLDAVSNNTIRVLNFYQKKGYSVGCVNMYKELNLPC
jgi:ribosomal protein S18 acetylase RimI-like enzyme